MLCHVPSQSQQWWYCPTLHQVSLCIATHLADLLGSEHEYCARWEGDSERVYFGSFTLLRELEQDIIADATDLASELEALTDACHSGYQEACSTLSVEDKAKRAARFSSSSGSQRKVKKGNFKI